LKGEEVSRGMGVVVYKQEIRGCRGSQKSYGEEVLIRHLTNTGYSETT